MRYAEFTNVNPVCRKLHLWNLSGEVRGLLFFEAGQGDVGSKVQSEHRCAEIPQIFFSQLKPASRKAIQAPEFLRPVAPIKELHRLCNDLPVQVLQPPGSGYCDHGHIQSGGFQSSKRRGIEHLLKPSRKWFEIFWQNRNVINRNVWN